MLVSSRPFLRPLDVSSLLGAAAACVLFPLSPPAASLALSWVWCSVVAGAGVGVAWVRAAAGVGVAVTRRAGACAAGAGASGSRVAMTVVAGGVCACVGVAS